MNIAKGFPKQSRSVRLVSADKFGKAGKLQLPIISDIKDDGR